MSAKPHLQPHFHLLVSLLQVAGQAWRTDTLGVHSPATIAHTHPQEAYSRLQPVCDTSVPKLPVL